MPVFPLDMLVKSFRVELVRELLQSKINTRSTVYSDSNLTAPTS